MTRQVDSDQEFVLIYSFFTGRSSQREAVMVYMNPQAFVVLIPQNNEGILHRPCRKHLLHTLCMLPCCLPLLSPSLFHRWINATVLFTSVSLSYSTLGTLGAFFLPFSHPSHFYPFGVFPLFLPHVRVLKFIGQVVEETNS